MFKNTFQVQLLFGFALALLLIAGINYLSYKSIRSFNHDIELVKHTQEVLLSNNEVLVQLLNAETGQRGFIATGRESYLDPYIRASVTLNRSISKLQDLISDNDRQVQRVDSIRLLASMKMSELAETIQLKRTQGHEAALRLVLTDKGRNQMLDIRRLSREIATEEKQLLKKRDDASIESTNETIRNIIIGVIVVFLIIMVMFFYILRTFRMQQEAEARVIRSNEDLQRLSEENLRKNWLLTGSGEVNEQLRGENEVTEICMNVIATLAKYVDAQLGSIYLYDEEQRSLWLAGTYAYPMHEGINKLALGEGLVGQSAAEKRSIVFNNIPDDYVKIQSSLGTASPKSVLVAPFILNGKLKGVIELGFASLMSSKTQELLALVIENISIGVQAAQSRERMQKLFEQIQMQAEELESQQEELRQTNEELSTQAHLLQQSEEELKVQQEELKQTNVELEEKAALLEERNQLVEETRAAVEVKARELEQTNRYKSEFLANMSHELRTPLNSILILARLLSENKHETLNAEEVKFASVIHKAGVDLLTLINDILDLSKIESGKLDLTFEEVSVKEIADDMMSMFREVAAGKRIVYKIDVKDNLPSTIVTDKMRLEQVIRNLLSNAFKFTQEEGTVFLKFERAKNDRLQISVTDTGIGIAPEKQKLIFEAFQQADGSTSRKYGGTGLGLSISRELSALLGGEISLTSVYGEGSTFIFEVPFEAAEITETPLIAPDYEPAPVTNRPAPIQEVQISSPRSFDQDTTVLIVEDDPEFAEVLRRYAKQKGFNVVLASDGQQALDEARAHLPDAVILDIQLPVMDGWEVLKRMRSDAALKNIPVHVMSATDKNNAAMGSSQAMSFISKPVDKESLEHIFGRLQHEFNPTHNKVLLIEDQQIQSDDLRDALHAQGFQVDQAFSGEEGMKKFAADTYDCVILDIRLPDMSGTEVLARIKADEKNALLPVIINTAMEVTPEVKQEIMRHGNAVVIKTQQSNERLMDEVKLFMNRVRQEQERVKRLAVKRSTGTLEKTLQHKKVLLVDDDMRNIFALSSMLQQYEMYVEIANNGVEALQKMDSHPETDIVLMDIMMPEMDGYEAMRRIRQSKIYSDVPIIALTAKAMKNDREKCIEAGANDYISKPVDVEKLISMMRVWLSK